MIAYNGFEETVICMCARRGAAEPNGRAFHSLGSSSDFGAKAARASSFDPAFRIRDTIYMHEHVHSDGNTNSRERDSSVERTLVTAVCRLGGGSIPQTRHSHYFSVSFSSTSVSAWRIGCVLVAYTAVRTRALASRRFDFVRYGVTTLYCLLENKIFILELEAVGGVCVCVMCVILHSI
jgi:hypothetical protein